MTSAGVCSSDFSRYRYEKVFHTRCPYAMERCRIEEPLMKEARSGHFVACHLR